MKVFVYDDLRYNQKNSGWMTHAQWLGFYSIMGYELYDCACCAAVICGNGILYGEVYRIDSGLLHQLDQLKGSPKKYKRHLISTPWGRAWIYIYQCSTNQLKRIYSGDWLKRDD